MIRVFVNENHDDCGCFVKSDALCLVKRGDCMYRTAISLALAPTVALAVFIYQKDRYDREPPDLLLRLFLLGALSAVPVYFIESALSFVNIFSGTLSALYTAFVVAAATEEFSKRFVIVRLVCKNRHYDEKLDGIVYSAFTSLGFASVENLGYVLSERGNFVYTGITRGIFAVPAHMLFGITMGYYLSLAKFAADERTRSANFKKSLYVPILLHGTYDFILMSGLGNLMIILVLFVIYLWRVNLIKLNQYIRESEIKRGQQTSNM